VGSIVQSSSSELYIAVEDGFIRILELQLQGRKRMKTEDFMNGFQFQQTDVFK
jgi:methionyl-tRNA formyltransferase